MISRFFLLALLVALLFVSTSFAMKSDSDVDIDSDVDVDVDVDVEHEVEMHQEAGFEMELEDAPTATGVAAATGAAFTSTGPAPVVADAVAPAPSATGAAASTGVVEPKSALKSNRTYVAVTKSVKLTADNINCLINLTPNKVNVIAVKAWSKGAIDTNYTSNVALITSTAAAANVNVKLHTIFKPSAFKTEADALAQVSKFVDATKADSYRRVWVKVGGKSWKNAAVKNRFALLKKIVSAFDAAFTAQVAGTTNKKRTVGIMTSNKGWRAVMGATQKGDALRKYKLWLIKGKKHGKALKRKAATGKHAIATAKKVTSAKKAIKKAAAKVAAKKSVAAKKAALLELLSVPAAKPIAAKAAAAAQKPKKAGAKGKGKKGPKGKKHAAKHGKHGKHGKKGKKRFDAAWRPTVRTFRGLKRPANGFCAIRGVRIGMSRERKQKKNGGKKSASGAKKAPKAKKAAKAAKKAAKKANKGPKAVKKNIKRVQKNAVKKAASPVKKF